MIYILTQHNLYNRKISLYLLCGCKRGECKKRETRLQKNNDERILGKQKLKVKKNRM